MEISSQKLSDFFNIGCDLTYIIPGSGYGYEGYLRLGFGPGTPMADVRAGLEQIDRFQEDFRAGKMEV